MMFFVSNNAQMELTITVVYVVNVVKDVLDVMLHNALVALAIYY